MPDDLFGYSSGAEQKNEAQAEETLSPALYPESRPDATDKKNKEERPLDRLRDLEKKIADAISKVKAIKEEKTSLEQRISELEARLSEKDREIESLLSEKVSVRDQIEELIEELESLETGIGR